MEYPTNEFARVELPQDPQDLVWGVVAENFRKLNQAGVPSGMHRIGSYVANRCVESNEQYTAPALIAGLGETHIATPEYESFADQIAAARSAVMGMLEEKDKAPGTVKLSVYDGPLSGAFGAFAALGPELYERVEPNGLPGFLDQEMNRHARLNDSKTIVGSNAEPWHINVVIGGDRDSEQERFKLDKLIAAGPKYGSIVTVNVPVRPSEHLHRGWPYPVEYDNPSAEDIDARCQAIALEASKGAEPPELSTILSGEMWTRTAHDALVLSPGLGPDGKPHEITIGKDNPHVLLTGPSGKGKTVLEKALILSLGYHYPPSEAKVILLDFKEGTEFSNFAPHSRDPAFLPNAEVVGTNMNEDLEFGMAALRSLSDEITRRGARGRLVGADNYTALRYKDPDGDWPRILLVMDEFQVLLNSPMGKEAASLLDDIGRRGRGFGLHILLATQDVGGIDALYSKSIFANFGIRIAMQQGSLLKPENTAPSKLPARHAVVNEEAGEVRANVVIKVPNASNEDQERVAPYMQQYYQKMLASDSANEIKQPRIFDGYVRPDLESSVQFQKLQPTELAAEAFLGAEMTVKGGAARFTLSRDSARNLAIIGQRRTEANSVLHTAAMSLAKQRVPGQAVFSLVCLDSQSTKAVAATADALREQGHQVKVVPSQKAPSFFKETSAALDPESEASQYIMVYGADANGTLMKRPTRIEHPKEIGDRDLRFADGDAIMDGQVLAARKQDFMDTDKITSRHNGTVEIRDGQVSIIESGKSGRQYFRTILDDGPESGVHVLASFSDIARMSEVATEFGRPKSFGAYVAFGEDLEPLMADGQSQTDVLNRPNRGTFYSRFQSSSRASRAPQTIIPFTDRTFDRESSEDLEDAVA